MSHLIKHRSIPLLLLPALCGLLLQPLMASAQTASPRPAGGNAGNNSPGSSISPISTPNFSTNLVVPTTPGVTVEPDGTISAPPAVQASVNNAVVAAVIAAESSPLAPVVSATTTAVTATQLVDTNQPLEIALATVSGQTSQTFLTLPNEISKEFTAGTIGSNATVTSPITGNTGTVVLAQNGIVVTVAGSEVVFPVTSQNQVSLAQFAAISIAAGLTTQSINAGLQIVSAGVTPIQVAQLMVSLQGLVTATSLTPLSNGINAFNTILNSASDASIAALETNSTFLAARSMLIAASSALGS